MPIPIACPGCGRNARLADRFAGQRVTCPDCRTPIDVPSPQAYPVAQPLPQYAAPAPEFDLPGPAEAESSSRSYRGDSGGSSLWFHDAAVASAWFLAGLLFLGQAWTALQTIKIMAEGGRMAAEGGLVVLFTDLVAFVATVLTLTLILTFVDGARRLRRVERRA